MRRINSIVIVLFAVVITAFTFFVPPAFPEGKDIEHGFPFPWAFQTELPGAKLPIIGWFISALSIATLTFSWQFFLADMAIYCTVLFMIFRQFERREDVEPI